MKLFLTSSGITNPTLANGLLKLLGKPFNKSYVTFIPTAANVEKGDKTWLVNDMYNIKKLGFSIFDIADISIIPKDVWLPSFQAADLLVFGGGTAVHLMEWMEKSGLTRVLPKLLKTKVYMGISAGSMVTAETISLASQNILYYEQTGEFSPRKGLGLVDFEIRPHLNSPSFSKVRIGYLTQLAQKNPTTFYAIDDNTAVQVIDDKVVVVTEGKWKKFN